MIHIDRDIFNGASELCARSKYELNEINKVQVCTNKLYIRKPMYGNYVWESLKIIEQMNRDARLLMDKYVNEGGIMLGGSLEDTKLKNIDPIKHLKKLKCLTLYNLVIDDLGSLSNLTSLTDLYLIRSRADDLTPLSNLNGLNCAGYIIVQYINTRSITVKESTQFKIIEFICV
jgi:hypothetical protein